MTAADDGDAERGGAVEGCAGEEALVLGAVDDAGAGLREGGGDLGAAADGDEDVLRFEGCDGAGRDVAGLDSEGADGLGGGGLFWVDGEDFGVVGDGVFECGGAPAHVGFVFEAAGEEGADVAELGEALVAVEVVDEGEFGTRVAEGGQVLEEGDLHLRPGNLHTGVPSEVGLTLEEGDFWESRGVLARGRVAEGVV